MHLSRELVECKLRRRVPYSSAELITRFLWVALQIHDICERRTDAGIRSVMKDLPKGLPATYERTLNKIKTARTTMFAQKR